MSTAATSPQDNEPTPPEQPAASYKVTLHGPGISFDRAVGRVEAEGLLVFLLTGQSPSGAQSPPSTVRGRAAGATPEFDGTPLSFREFLDACEPKRLPDKIAAAGVFLKQHQGVMTFTSRDVIDQFEAAGEPRPGNFTRDMAWAVKIGWIAPKTGEKDVYFVTNQGTKVVEQRFPAELVKKTKGITTYKPKAKKGSESDSP